MFQNMNEAIRQGMKDYKDCPMAYPSVESAIKYRVAEFIWDSIAEIDKTIPGEYLKAIKKLNE